MGGRGRLRDVIGLPVASELVGDSQTTACRCVGQFALVDAPAMRQGLERAQLLGTSPWWCW